jgi:hypothetical protein
MKSIKQIKSLIILLVLSISFSTVYGGEVTGAGFVKNIMKKKEMNLQHMLNNGHDLLLGEVTGAGLTVPLDKIKILVTAKEAFKMSNIQRIEFKKAGGIKLINVDFFEIQGKIIETKSLKALVVKK